MKVTLNSGFFRLFNSESDVWQTLNHAAEETGWAWTAPSHTPIEAFRLEYDLCEQTAVETFRITNRSGRVVYIHDTRKLPCANSSAEQIADIMQLMNQAWRIGGTPEDYRTGTTQTALERSYSWFIDWMKSMYQQKIEAMGKLKVPCHPDLCKQLTQGV